MRICKDLGLAIGCFAAAWTAAAAWTVSPVQAFDAAAKSTGALAAQPFGSVKDALRAGVREYNAGDKLNAVRSLDYAASHGNTLALWKLGRMFADGDGVARDDARAFRYFSRIADDNADEAPDSPRAAVVANAFVSLGSYHLDGIAGTSVRPNPERAAEMFSYAASYFGDPNAQYSLARLYLDGQGLDRDVRQAARWLNLAAEKGHGSAQALLGQLLVSGDGIPRQRARGLMWLELALQRADARTQDWIKSLHAEAFGEASETDRRTAMALSEQFQARRR